MSWQSVNAKCAMASTKNVRWVVHSTWYMVHGSSQLNEWRKNKHTHNFYSTYFILVLFSSIFISFGLWKYKELNFLSYFYEVLNILWSTQQSDRRVVVVARLATNYVCSPPILRFLLLMCCYCCYSLFENSDWNSIEAPVRSTCW